MKTSRLTLTPLATSDLEFMYRLNSDPNVMKYIREIDSKISQTEKVISDMLEYSKKFPGYGLWIARLSDNTPIGWGIVIHIDKNSENPIEVGYRLLEKFWGQGYATEITGALLNYAKNKLKLNSLCAITLFDNLASQNVLLKSGFIKAGIRHYYQKDVLYFEKKPL
ncbi:MAG: GNAT family N-acetyltransferase [Bacteriovoracaceae bacterium]|nr:GNAT family N-acetyltransferase [Bacteriovoracaceae bacterium]